MISIQAHFDDGMGSTAIEGFHYSGWSGADTASQVVYLTAKHLTLV